MYQPVKSTDSIKDLLRVNKDEIIAACAGHTVTVIYEDGVIAVQGLWTVEDPF